MDDEYCFCGRRLTAEQRRCPSCDADLRLVRRLRAQQRADDAIEIGPFGTVHTANGGCATGLWNGLVIYGWLQILLGAVVLGVLLVGGLLVLLIAVFGR